MAATTVGSLDLPPELQRELKDLAAREGKISHYELLGIPADADGGAVRRAYLERSKRLHPDAWYRKNVGEYATLLSRAFQRIAAAYQVLSDDDARAEYDAEQAKTFSAADKTRVEKRMQDRADDERRAKERRERLMRSKGFARLGAARQLYESAVELAAKGQRGFAIAELKSARELDPQRKEIAQKLAELEKEAAKARSVSACVAAGERAAQGDFDRAIALYTAAHQSDPTNPEAARGIATAAAEKGEWPLAATWIPRAVEAAPTHVETRLLAGRVYAAVKNKARAKAELQFVLDKIPNHEEARALLKRL
ncbi:MAG: DnaJ domain-containing protein [Deltaproteobacteria bacterium]|nr:DnaJ domain-containing protein [Deltaproteobacteria bacterium]